MSDFTSLLTSVADRADSSALPDPPQIRAVVRRRRTRAAAAGAAVVMVAVASVVAVVGGSALTGSRLDSPPAVGTPSPTAPTSPTNAPTSADSATPTFSDDEIATYGEPVTVQPGLDALDLRAVTYKQAQGGGASVYVVVGDSSGGMLTGAPAVPRPIWWSDDAHTWHHATSGPSFPNVWDVTSYGGGFVAIAPREQRSGTVWYSANGADWTRGQTPRTFDAYGIAATHVGLFAWDDHHVFVSSGATRWTEETDLPDLGGLSLCMVGEVNGKVVLGAKDPNGSILDKPSAWILDGTWRPAPPKTALGPAGCNGHENAQTSATGPAGTVTLRPGTEIFNTVFVKKDLRRK